uniref:Protein kinase domain-containing protein n=1 Tax=Rhizophagus irregularis (strain DAOM 181602 / DAOM 197198 / MUCL 43194) TaxID=747089 RepID=U9UEJ7_RHIID
MEKWCKPCQINNLKQNFTNWTSGNEKIDDFIQEMQLKIEKYKDMIVEWVPYDQFINVKKIGKDGFATAIWKNGSLKYNYKEIKYERKPNKEVTLKCLSNSQNNICDLLDKAKAYSIKYGISQNPDTNDYIIVLNNSYCKECGERYTGVVLQKWCKPCQINNLKHNFTNWTSGNEKIDDFIQEMQLKIERTWDIIVEWIPYSQFNNVKKIGKDGFATAIWKNGSLKFNNEEIKYERKPDKVTLKCLNNSQNIISDLLNEVCNF